MRRLISISQSGGVTGSHEDDDDDVGAGGWVVRAGVVVWGGDLDEDGEDGGERARGLGALWLKIFRTRVS